MIKVLIIEDNNEKLGRVKDFLQTVCKVKGTDIDSCGAVNPGRTALMERQYDLLLLDLVLPVNENEDPSAENGTNFLDEIHYNPNINIPIHIIGLTEFDQVFKDFYETFEDKLWGLINFRLSDNDWTNKLKSKVFYLQNFKEQYQSFLEKKNKYDVAIVTALNTEFQQLLRSGAWTKVSHEDDQLVYFETILNTKNNNNIRIIACSFNQMGMQAAASVGAKVIAKFSPGHIFITGICAGFADKGLKLGDIIVATQCWDYESGKVIENESGELVFNPDMKLIPTDQGIISRITDFSNDRAVLSRIHDDFAGNKPDNTLKVHFGSVGSGPYVLSSKEYLKKLTESDRKLLGIDMEGFGIYKAGQFFKSTVPVFIKSVSDFGDEKKSDDYHAYSAYTSANFTLKFLYDQF